MKINGETHYLWRAVDHEGEVLEVFVTKRRDRRAALTFLKRAMERYGLPASIVTDRLRSYRAAMNVIGNAADQTCGRWGVVTLSEIGRIWTINQQAKSVKSLASTLAIVGKFRPV